MVSDVALAQGDLIVYPNKGQSAQQQEKDKYECFTWAKQQTGFDPMAMPTASAPPPQKEAQQGGFMRGAVRGGAVGAVAGAIGDDAGKGVISAICTRRRSRRPSWTRWEAPGEFFGQAKENRVLRAGERLERLSKM